jgi:peptidyl-prolyl cis-trans isomerase A (cyclophilin A)
MRQLVQKIGNLIRRGSRKTLQPSRTRLVLEVLEDRSLLSGGAFGDLSGFAFIDANNNGVRDARETTLPGVLVNLTGTTSQGTAANVTAITDANGAFSFVNVLPGTYQIQTGSELGLTGGGARFGGQGGSPGVDVVPAFTVGGGQTVIQDVGFGGLPPQFISLRLFLTTTSPTATSPFMAPAGNGQVVNTPPAVTAPIADVAVAVNSADTMVDLTNVFNVTNVADTRVRFDTSAGPVNVELFDTRAPLSVANVLNYIQSGRYTNTVFHRLVSNFVLQGGGFTFNPNAPSLTPVATDPPVKNEFEITKTPQGTPIPQNIQGTLALAKLGGDPNSATSQFFFNLADNSSNLDSQNGGFTVFGKLVGANDQAVVNALAATPIRDQSNGSSSSPFGSIPLNNYSGTNFPTDTTLNNYALVRDAAVVSRSAVFNSNPGLVTATFTPSTPSTPNNSLTLHYAAGATGTAVITVQVSNQFGATENGTFTVTVQ